MNIETIKNKTPKSLTKKEYFVWLEDAVNEVAFTVRSEELDEIARSLEAANELAPNREFKEGVGVAMRIVWGRKVQLLKEKK